MEPGKGWSWWPPRPNGEGLRRSRALEVCVPSMDCRACSGEGCDTKLPTLPGPPRPPKSAPLLPMGLGDRPHTGLGGRMPATHTQPNTAHTVKNNEKCDNGGSEE